MVWRNSPAEVIPASVPPPASPPEVAAAFRRPQLTPANVGTIRSNALPSVGRKLHACSS